MHGAMLKLKVHQMLDVTFCKNDTFFFEHLMIRQMPHKKKGKQELGSEAKAKGSIAVSGSYAFGGHLKL